MLPPPAAQVFDACSRESLADDLPFPEVLRRCAAAGIERYAADLVAGTKTAYDGAGGWQVGAEPLPALAVAERFDAAALRAALAEIQQGRIGYRAFLQRIAAAGVAAYAVFIAGRRAIYWGRRGDEHVERFPPQP